MSGFYYRPLMAGDTATKAALDDREPPSAKKTSNQSVNNTIVQVADNQLTVTLAANALYLVRAVIIVSGPAAANFRSSWTAPAGASGTRFTHGPPTAVASVGQTQLHARSAPIGTVLGYGTDGTSNSLIVERLWVTTAATSGALTFTWAQFTATVGSTTVRTGSRIRAERVV